MTHPDGRGVGLDEYTKLTPPGWSPGMTNYPLRLYFEKLRLWLRLTDVQERSKLGTMLAGRSEEQHTELS